MTSHLPTEPDPEMVYRSEDLVRVYVHQGRSRAQAAFRYATVREVKSEAAIEKAVH